jgi:phosphomevalonate kinase
VTVLASAPGKLVLVGEYAVLEGAPALVLAVDRRVRVTIAPAAGEDTVVEARGAAAAVARYPRGAMAPTALPLVDAILDALGETLGLDHAPPFAATLDTTAFVERDGERTCKLGLGSSAALTVAFASAVAEYTGRAGDPGTRSLDGLITVHRHFQRGRGSGLDVAASLSGGVISYRVTGADASPTAVQRQLPVALHLLPVWSGRSASTGDALERLERWRADAPAAHAACFAELCELAAAADDAARAGDAQDLLATLRAYGPALRRLGEASGIDVWSAEHSAIESLARARGAAYKPCGAGGGDVGLACSEDATALAALRADLARAGYRALDLGIDPVGLQVQPRLE